MKNKIRKMIMAVLACVCFAAMPVYAAEDPNAVFEQGNKYSEEGQHEEAIECYEKVIDLAEEQGMELSEYIGCYRNIAISYGNLKWYYKAIETLLVEEELAIECGKTDLLPEVYTMLAEYYYNIGVYQHAINYGKKTLETASNQWEAYAYRIIGLALMECGDYDGALGYIDAYLSSPDANYLHGMDLEAQLMEKMGNYMEASALYLEVAKEPQYANSYTEKAAAAVIKDCKVTGTEYDNIVSEYLIGPLGYGEAELESFYFNIKEYDKAFEYLEKALEKEPESLNVLYNYGGAKCNTGQYKDAEEAFRKVHEADPDFGSVALYLGYALEGQGKFDEALTYYKEAFSKNPEYTSAVLEMKDCYLAQGNREAALVELDAAISGKDNIDNSLLAMYINLNNNFSNTDFSDELQYYSQSKQWPETEKMQAYFVINNIAINYLNNDRLDAYINYLESQDMEDYLILCELGYCYRNKGECTEAIKCMEAAKELAPDCEGAILQDEMVIYHAAGKVENAIRFGNEGSGISSINMYCMYYTAFLEMIYNEYYDYALTTAEQILNIDPNSTYGWELKYMTYYYMGDYENALESVNNYLKVSPKSNYAKAYKVLIAKAANTPDLELENELMNTPLNTANSDSVYVPALLGDKEKVKENLTKYLEYYPSAYTKAAVANNTAMKEMMNDPEIAVILTGAASGSSEETAMQQEEGAGAENNSENKAVKGMAIRFVIPAIIMVLGIVLVVVSGKKRK